MGLPILFTRRDAGDTAAYCRSEVPHYLVGNYQFMNYYTGNDRAMPNGDPRVFGFPCRFPARLSILVERRAQVDDPTRFFGAGGVPKNFYPEFSRAAGKLERRRYPAESGGGRAI